MAEALRLSRVFAGYGETVVLEDLSLAIAPGESLSVIGRNGVGKTTLLSTIMGHTTLHGGGIALDGHDLSRMPIHQRSQAGLGYVPQEREIFPSLSVRENLIVAARPGRWTEDAVYDLFPPLAERLSLAGNQLSGGEQQMLSIARALIGNPTVLLMDEPTEGLAPVVVKGLVQTMKLLSAEGELTILLTEQNTRIALAFSERTAVLDRGRIVYDGSSATLKADEKLLNSLIGVTR